MQDILEWWTGRRLVHTSTFGVRIYHRDSMLINHVSGAWSAPAPAVSHTLPLLLTTHTSPLLQVDRSDTHLASAVIQIDQKTDENGGWPLEVMDADGKNLEQLTNGRAVHVYPEWAPY